MDCTEFDGVGVVPLPLVGVKIFFVAFYICLLMIPDLVCLHYDMPHTNKPLIASPPKLTIIMIIAYCRS